jgi:Zn-dependent M28 family amino/carboxypeptidase
MTPFSRLITFSFVSVLLLPAVSLAQMTPTTAAKTDAAPASAATTFAETITATDLKKHLSILAADDMEGRETGSPGQKRAGAYIAKQFETLGLKPIAPNAAGQLGYFQPFNVYQKTWGDFYVKAGGKQFNYLSDFIVNGLFSIPTETSYETVFVGYGISDTKYDDYAGRDIQGKAIVILEGEPKTKTGTSLISGSAESSKWGAADSWRIKATLAKEKGAAQIFMVSATSSAEFKRLITERGTLLSRFNRMSLEPAQEKIGAVGFFTVSPEIAASLLAVKSSWLKKAAEHIAKTGKPLAGEPTGKVTLKAERKDATVQTENVLGFLEGSDKKDEIVVISSHYDHIGISPDGQINNGADDDGSGTSSVLELAEAFAKAKAAGQGPRRSILFITVTGEEKGLFGSEYYTDHPILPLANTVCDLNIDMIGRVDDAHKADPKYVYLIGSDKLSSDLHSISEAANKQHVGYALDYTYNDPNDPNRFYYRSDHYNFARKKIPVIFYFTGVHEDYHKPGDDVEKIMFDKQTPIVKLVFYTAWDIANRDERIKVDSNKP